LFKKDVPMALATSSHRHHYHLKTENHQTLFRRAFRHIVTGDQVSSVT
jgi:hypothetical protein